MKFFFTAVVVVFTVVVTVGSICYSHGYCLLEPDVLVVDVTKKGDKYLRFV